MDCEWKKVVELAKEDDRMEWKAAITMKEAALENSPLVGNADLLLSDDA